MVCGVKDERTTEDLPGNKFHQLSCRTTKPRPGDCPASTLQLTMVERPTGAFQLCVSPFVEEECKRGDAEVVMRRLGYLKEALMLAPADHILLLRDVLLQPHGPLPVRAATDALHIGTAA